MSRVISCWIIDNKQGNKLLIDNKHVNKLLIDGK